jgi:hypothetical protein
MPDSPISNRQHDPATDILLFQSSRYSSLFFAPVKSGTDIYVKINSGSPSRIYLLHWSERPGEMNECTAISEECAIRILRELAAMPETIAGMEFTNIYRHLPGYFIGKERSLGTVYVLQDEACGEYVEYFRKPPDVEGR